MRRRLLVSLAIACSLATGSAVADAPASAAPGQLAAAAAPETAAAAAPAAMQAASAAAPAIQPAPSPAASAGNLVQTILALTLVLGLLAGLAWFFKRYGPKAAAGAAGLRIVGALNLGGRERIMVLEIGDQWIVVGAAPGRVNALATMPKQEGGPLQASAHDDAPPAGSFADWLKQTINKRNAN